MWRIYITLLLYFTWLYGKCLFEFFNEFQRWPISDTYTTRHHCQFSCEEKRKATVICSQTNQIVYFPTICHWWSQRQLWFPPRYYQSVQDCCCFSEQITLQVHLDLALWFDHVNDEICDGTILMAAVGLWQVQNSADTAECKFVLNSAIIIEKEWRRGESVNV